MGLLIAVVVLQLVVIVGLGVNILRQKHAIDKCLKVAQEIAQKNIEVDDVELKTKGSSKELAKAINTIKFNFLAFVEATKGNVITLTDAIGELQSATHATEKGAEQTSASLCTVAEKTSEQLDLVRDNLDIIEENNRQFDIIDESMKEISGTLEQSVEHCNQGIESLDNYERDMQVVSDNLNKCMGIMDEFNEQLKEVNNIGEMVIEVSEELQLLALNASIESARAGEAGKGFSVVSHEIGVMSERTKESMAEITNILQNVYESSGQVNESIVACNEAFATSAELFEQVSDSFRTISEQSAGVNRNMAEITDKYRMISDNSEVSKGKAEDVFAASGVISDSTREIVAISEETTAESEQIAANVGALEEMLNGIRNIIKEFKTGVMPTGNNRSQTVKIAFFSKLDNYFWYAIRRGVMYAEKEMAANNVQIIYIPYKDDIEEKAFPDDVDRLANEGVDAIIFPGFLSIANQQLKAAANRGVKVLAYNCDCDKSIPRISCYEPDQEEAGIMAADAVAKALNKSGNVAIVLGDKTAAVNKIRYDSFVERINSHYKDIKIVDTIEVSYNADQTYQQELQLLKNNNNIDAVYSTTGMQVQLAQAIIDSGNKGKVKAVVFDQNDEIFRFIKMGVIAAAIDHDPFSQGHDPIVLMYNHLVDGDMLAADRIKCKASVVDSDNINTRITS